MTEEELREIFQPDEYGFCAKPLGEKKNAVWFDTVLKVVATIDAARDGSVDWHFKF